MTTKADPKTLDHIIYIEGHKHTVSGPTVEEAYARHLLDGDYRRFDDLITMCDADTECGKTLSVGMSLVGTVFPSTHMDDIMESTEVVLCFTVASSPYIHGDAPAKMGDCREFTTTNAGWRKESTHG